MCDVSLLYDTPLNHTYFLECNHISTLTVVVIEENLLSWCEFILIFNLCVGWLWCTSPSNVRHTPSL